MTKIAYLECPTGVAGDMCLGALVHAGVPLEYLSDQLKRLGISHEYALWAETVERNGQAATKVHVELHRPPDTDYAAHAEPGVDPHPTFGHHMPAPSVSDPIRGESLHLQRPATHSAGDAPGHVHSHEDSHPHPHSHPHDRVASTGEIASQVPHAEQPDQPPAGSRHLPDIEQLIKSAGFSARAEAWSLSVFRQLAVAEGAVHGIPPEAVHFHEVGATDAIVDVVGTCLGLDWLEIDQLYCSALPTGGGTVWAAHGRLPVPTPAVLKLWEMRQVPVYSNGIDRELVTPTGAAIATTLSTQFGPPPPMTLHRVGLGAGSRELPIPNILRLWVGESTTNSSSRSSAQRLTPSPPPPIPHAQPAGPTLQPPTEAIAVLETQIDDASPQAIAYAFDQLFEAGAVDVFTQPVMMKKSRLGTLLTVICHPAQAEECERTLFRETPTLGIRRSLQQRTLLYREIVSVKTVHGNVRVKLARAQPSGEILNAQPEYEDCAKIAYTAHLPWQDIHRLALQEWHAAQV